jgi:hypothetical protein
LVAVIPAGRTGRFQPKRSGRGLDFGRNRLGSVGVGNTSLGNIVRSFKSIDGGKTWRHDSVVSGTQNNVDKPVLWVDHSPSSPYRDNMYALWWNNGPTYVSRRIGPGGAWGAPQRISHGETTGRLCLLAK